MPNDFKGVKAQRVQDKFEKLMGDAPGERTARRLYEAIPAAVPLAVGSVWIHAVTNEGVTCKDAYRIKGARLDTLPRMTWDQIYNLDGVRGKTTPHPSELLPVVEEICDV